MSPSARDNSPSQLTDWLRVQLRWVTVPSWLISGLFHIALAALIVFLTQLPSCRGDLSGDDGESFRDVGIHVRPAKNEADSDSETELDETSESSDLVYENPLKFEEPLLDTTPPVELQLPSIDIPNPVIGAGSVPVPSSVPTQELVKPNLRNDSPSSSNPSGGDVAGGTSFMGIRDVGKSFVFVIDRSYSMDNDGALAAAKSELLASLSQLDENQQFQIIFYSNEAEVLRPRDDRFDMFWGTDAQRMQVSGRLKSIFASGGTDHLPALSRALNFRPDVIYLLTDGAAESALDSSDMNEIKRLNRSGTRINCIEFGRSSEPAIKGEANFLWQIAHRNQGKYVYVNVNRSRL
ncbi:VWA domain-containing protein [Thalassoglobus sp. JC818]|uniref:vWA domain-containing protein n=1 Tax=Thalassoglobus sp. JC818 TaxID=3232136 RepID=UPI003457900B